MAPRKSFEEVSGDRIPIFDMVPIYDGTGAKVTGFNGVRRLDTNRIVAVNTDRYELVQHRDVADAVDRLAETFGASAESIPEEHSGNRHFASVKQTLYDQGRGFEYRLVIPKRFPLGDGEAFYPGVRVTNSVNGKYAVTLSGFSLRLACTNQLYAEGGNLVNVRQLHVTKELDVLGILEKGIYSFLNEFEGTVDIYAQAMHAQIPAPRVRPALVEAKFPERHAKAVGELVAAQFGSSEISLWDAYQTTTEYLTHRMTPVAPPRARVLERIAARVLLDIDEDAEEREEAIEAA